jgi:predicted ribonuclease YlaK
VSSILYLFADTDLFIQCRALGELDWSAWNSFDEVHVIVSRPVQREIDYRKNKGSDRVGDRARSTNKLFKELVQGDKDHMLLRETGPSLHQGRVQPRSRAR